MSTKLIGTDTPGSSLLAPNCLQYNQFVCALSGSLSSIKVYCGVSTNVKVGIYSDVANVATSLLAHSDSTAVTAGDWRDVPLTAPVNIVAGTKYWLAVNMQVDGGCNFRTGTGFLYNYQVLAYASDFPATATPVQDYTVYECSLQGWGTSTQTICPSSIIQPVSYGTPEIIITGALTIQPSSIVQVVAIGAPTLLYPQILLPSSIIQAIVYGTPSLGVYGIIVPQSIVQQISIGSPTILKYVWHVILDGQYIAESPDINRAYVIGRDANGNPIYGEAHDTTESALVGERLDFQPDPAIPTTAQAGDVASAILAKMRLTGKRGVILIPPNCGQELFDVVQISDAGANQSAVTFRVVGIRFEYNPKQARYQHKLILGAP